MRVIIDYASDHALLTLRATCKEYRDLIDSTIFAHVVACMPAGHRRGRDIELRSATAPYRLLPFLPWQAAEPPGARKAIRNEARKRQLGYVHVVDFGSFHSEFFDRIRRLIQSDIGNVLHDDYDDGFDDATSNENSLRAASALIAPFLSAHPRPSPLTVRRRNGLVGRASVNLSAATYVDYCQYPPGPTAVTVLHDLQAARLVIPSCRSYVLHLAYDPFWPSIWQKSMTVVLPPSIESITLVMNPATHDGPTGRLPDRPLGMLRTLLWGFIHYLPNVKLQLVGVENMHPSTLGFPAGDEHVARPHEVVARVREMINTLAEGVPNDSTQGGLCFAASSIEAHLRPIPDALSRISIPTFEEWEASLSPSQRPILATPPQYEPF